MNLTSQVVEYGMPLPRGVVKAKSAVSSVLHFTVTLTCDILTTECEAFISVP